LPDQAADLIERNEVEHTLRESREQFRWIASIVEFSDDAIVSQNLECIIRSWNKGAERLFGYLAEEIMGKPLTPDGLKHAIAGRIEALANVHSLFAQSRWTGAELDSLVEQELPPYCRDGDMRAD
jgi:PAS domain-containing protein